MVVHIVQPKVHSILFVNAFPIFVLDGLIVFDGPDDLLIGASAVAYFSWHQAEGEFLRVVFAHEVELSWDCLGFGTGGRHASSVESIPCRLIVATGWKVVDPCPL